VRELVAAAPDVPFYACDVRGIGESRPETGSLNSFLQGYGSDYFYAIHSLMLDRPYVAQKTHDLLSVLDLLGSFGHEQVHLVGRGWGSVPATFAALLSARVTQVTLKNALPSYLAVASTEQYHWPLSSFLPDVIGRFDLPDCYRALTAAKKLRQIDPSPA
jgi:pimeloyl-ACP methyl ester carboxylesterase